MMERPLRRTLARQLSVSGRHMVKSSGSMRHCNAAERLGGSTSLTSLRQGAGDAVWPRWVHAGEIGAHSGADHLQSSPAACRSGARRSWWMSGDWRRLDEHERLGCLVGRDSRRAADADGSRGPHAASAARRARRPFAHEWLPTDRQWDSQVLIPGVTSVCTEHGTHFYTV